MQDVSTVRRINLSVLMDQFERQSDFARQLETSPSHLSQMKKGNRNIGNELARKIEERMGKPRGWMDSPQGWSKELVNTDAVLPNIDQLEHEDLLLLRSFVDRLLASK